MSWGVATRNAVGLGLAGIVSLVSRAVQQAVAVVDPFFNYVTLLLPGNGTNGAQNNTFVDSSTNAFTITRNGNTTQGSFSPFSQTGWGAYFDGTGDALTLPSDSALALGAGDFTVEAWVYNQNGVNLYPDITANSGSIVAFMLNDRFLIYRSVLSDDNYPPSGNAALLSATGTIAQNTWVHVAWVRSGSAITVYINGTASGTATSSTNHTREMQVIGAIAQGAAPNLFFWNGYISNLRIVKGTAVYTSAFTPPTAPLTAISGTSLLTCQSNRFIDNSSNAFAITRNGDVSVQAFSPFNPTASWDAATNGGSGYFDGSGDYLTLSTTSAMGTSDFTIEAFIYMTSISSDNWIFDSRLFSVDNTTGINIVFRNSTSKITVGSQATTYLTSTNSLTANQWYYVAVVRNSGTLTLYINGVSEDSASHSVNLTSTNLTIGSNRTGGNNFSGYISNLRTVIGSALAISSVPTAPLTAIANTSLLCNFTNAGIFDATAKNDLETVGNAQISTTQSQWGGSSMYFDGTGDYLISKAASPNLYAFGTGDFTIEFWYYSSNTGVLQVFYDNRPSATNGAYITFYKSASNVLELYVNAVVRATGTTSIASGTWYHVALCRSGTDTKMFLDGVQEGSTYSDSTNYLNPADRPFIGADSGNVGATPVNGYIQDLRITKGYARYTAAFTPPTAAFPLT